MEIRQTVLYNLSKKVYNKIEETFCYVKRKPLIPRLEDALLRLISSSQAKIPSLRELTIISSNCFAGRILQDFNLGYTTPTVGLYFMYPDYIEFLQNLKYYLIEAKLEFIDSSKYEIGNERRSKWKHWYPIGLLGGKVEIHFLHYFTQKEAEEKWYRRARRVNFDNLLIVGMDQNLCTEKDMIAFDSLPYKNKIMFSTRTIPLRSNEYMPEFRDSVGDPYKKAHIFYRHFLTHFKI